MKATRLETHFVQLGMTAVGYFLPSQADVSLNSTIVLRSRALRPALVQLASDLLCVYCGFCGTLPNPGTFSEL
jgi:hypothetical protein